MKFKNLIGIIFLVLILFTAVSFVSAEEVNDGNISNIDNLNSESNLNEDFLIDKDDYKFLEDKGYKVEEYSETNDDGDKYTGVKISKKYDSIDEITVNGKKSYLR